MAYTVGVDIGGTKIAVGVLSPEGELVDQSRKSTPARDSDAVLEVIVELVEAHQSDFEIAAVGIGTAGFIDAGRSRVIFAPNLGWSDEPFKLQVERALGLPTVIENDANAAAWGEFVFGAGQGRQDLVMVTVGTGIGGGIVLGGRLQRGAHGFAAEFGHLRLVPEGRLCGCGRHGCWEQYASGNALVRTTRELASDRRGDAGVLMSFGDGTPEGINGPDITEAARRGDPVALEAFEVLGTWLARGMVEVAALLDPGAFVVGGGVIDAGDLLLAPTKREYSAQLVARAQRAVTDIVPAKLGNLAGMYGAAHLARDNTGLSEEASVAKTVATRSAASAATAGKKATAKKSAPSAKQGAKKPASAKKSTGSSRTP